MNEFGKMIDSLFWLLRVRSIACAWHKHQDLFAQMKISIKCSMSIARTLTTFTLTSSFRSPRIAPLVSTFHLNSFHKFSSNFLFCSKIRSFKKKTLFSFILFEKFSMYLIDGNTRLCLRKYSFFVTSLSSLHKKMFAQCLNTTNWK